MANGAWGRAARAHGRRDTRPLGHRAARVPASRRWGSGRGAAGREVHWRGGRATVRHGGASTRGGGGVGRAGRGGRAAGERAGAVDRGACGGAGPQGPQGGRREQGRVTGRGRGRAGKGEV
jgi:hypothetical protein